MARTSSSTHGERIAVMETIMPELDKRLAKLESASEKHDEKLDKILRMGEIAAEERATQMATIKEMAPHVALIANVRRGSKFLMWVGASVGSLATTLLLAKGWFIMNWNWFFPK